ncbi:hypothetical protein GOP47_0004785 [Adiantum capillus-veneris]|uniref:Uncharacterized protein n=1 Tax=Adiantum capillus-veneris TaxID=13818 RepID=A0A9D4V3X5_ADICA|nr:hypothetical protein GOP47_0004785 [Adiantum capillus-veneris]
MLLKDGKAKQVHEVERWNKVEVQLAEEDKWAESEEGDDETEEDNLTKDKERMSQSMNLLIASKKSESCCIIEVAVLDYGSSNCSNHESVEYKREEDQREEEVMRLVEMLED